MGLRLRMKIKFQTEIIPQILCIYRRRSYSLYHFQKGPDGAPSIAEYTISGVSDQKVLAGIFGIAPDFDKISKAQLDAMSRGNQ